MKNNPGVGGEVVRAGRGFYVFIFWRGDRSVRLVLFLCVRVCGCCACANSLQVYNLPRLHPAAIVQQPLWVGYDM